MQPSNLIAESRYEATMITTPRPPGAWASTPAQPPISENLQSLPDEERDPRHQNGLATPAASLSRAGSLPLQTPAPPGGWVATPNRKSILKVRFDVEPPDSEISMSEHGNDPIKLLPGAIRESSPAETSLGTTKTLANGDVASSVPLAAKEDADGRTGTPVAYKLSAPVSPRSLRKSPSIRLVDAFGRERSSNNERVNGGLEKTNGSSGIDDGNRSRTTVRVVDAMGREVGDVVDESKLEDDRPLSRNEALTRVREGLADLANGLNEGDRYGLTSLDLVGLVIDQ